MKSRSIYLPCISLGVSALLASAVLAQSDEETSKKKDSMTDSPFLTFDQKDWGEEGDQSHRAAKLLEMHFEKAFPEGLVIGSPDAEEGEELFSLRFGTAKAIGRFLPQQGPPRTLIANSKDENPKLGGLAGQLVAAKLNLAFNEHGMMRDDDNLAKKETDKKESDKKEKGEEESESKLKVAKALELGEGHLAGAHFGKLVLSDDKEVPSMLVGVSIADLVSFSDRVISSEFGVYKENRKEGEVEYDVTGDGKPDMSLRDVRVALRLVNIAFEGGKDHGYLVKPTKESVERAKPIRKARRTEPLRGGDHEDMGGKEKRKDG